MTDRCEPPDGTAQNSLCWIEIDGKETTARWDAEDRIWTPERGTSFTATSPFAVKNRVRYVAPVPSPEAVRALVEAGRKVVSEEWRYPHTVHGVDALRAALAAFPEDKT